MANYCNFCWLMISVVLYEISVISLQRGQFGVEGRKLLWRGLFYTFLGFIRIWLIFSLLFHPSKIDPDFIFKNFKEKKKKTRKNFSRKIEFSHCYIYRHKKFVYRRNICFPEFQRNQKEFYIIFSRWFFYCDLKEYKTEF
jgi:hypothetical protein